MFGKRKSVNVVVYVKPSLRGSGLVKALLNTAENRAMNASLNICGLNMGRLIPMQEALEQIFPDLSI